MNGSNQKLNLLLFGATGRTGRIFLQMALEAGHHISAVVRNPEKVTISHLHLNIIRGDVTQLQSFNTIAKGHDAVISCIGAQSRNPTTLYSQGVANMLSAMQGAGINRIMCMSASAIETSPKLSFVLRLVAKYVLQRVFRHPYADNRRMEAILRESGTNWTSFRPPRLKDKPPTGKYRYAINDWLDKCLSINRADLAYFILQNITNENTYKAVVEVAN